MPRKIHLFEFSDLPWLPAAVRETLVESIAFGLKPPLRFYYRWVTRELRELVRRRGVTTVVELGAGTAPLSALLAGDPDFAHVTFVPCDLYPNRKELAALAKRFPGRVMPIYEPLDIAESRRWPAGTLLVSSASFHHIPDEKRKALLRNLSRGGGPTLVVFEPLRKTASSFMFGAIAFIAALLAPIGLAHRPGRARRLLLCWCAPVVPLMLGWDGAVSALRQWSAAEWRGIGRTGSYEARWFSHRMIL